MPLTLSSIYTHFNTLKKKPLENIVDKGEIALNEQFPLFPQCFLCNLYLEILSHISVVICSCFEFETVSKRCIRKWVKSLQYDKILDQFKLQASANANLNVTKMTKFVLNRLQNTVGK